MNHPKQILATALGITLLLAACKKNATDSNTAVTAADKAQINSLFADLRSTPQTFTTTAGTSSTIVGAEGTILKFYPNSFKDKNGNILTSGTINIQLIEMYKPGDMIANRATTYTSTYPLMSGGQVSLKVTKNGEEVFANKYGIGYSQPTSTAKPMELYYGNTNNADSAVSWTIASTTKQSLPGTTNIADTSWNHGGPYYLFDSCTSFNFINCDHPYDSTSGIATVNFIYSDSKFTIINSSIWVCFPSLNVVANFTGSITSYNTTLKTMKFNGYSPLGIPCKFVFISKVDGQYYYGSQSGTVSNNISVNVSLSSATLSEVSAHLKAL